MIPRYQVYRERIASELKDIRRAADKACRAFQSAGMGGTNEDFNLDATALNLHGFYSGIERLFEWIAVEFDGTVPTGSTWHRDLLNQMQLEVAGVRPAVIHAETRTALEEYLKFRHVVRNVYTWEFSGGKIKDLIDPLPATLRELETDLERFREFLAQAGHADETRP